MSVPFIKSADTITLFLEGYPKVIDNTHPKFAEISEFLKKPLDTVDQLLELVDLVNTAAAVQRAVEGTKIGDVTVGADAVLYKGQPINNYLTEVIIRLSKDGHDVTPWANFMTKLMQNPSRTAVQELYLWLDKAGMPLTQDGNFLAYKKVKDDFTSYHKGPNGLVVSNAPGEIVEMPRNEVDDERTRTCSYGLHFCSWHYLPSYYGSQGKVVVLSINPADVVSVPSDYDNAKGRACKYQVIGVIDEKAAEFAFADKVVYNEDDFDGWQF